MINNLEVFLRLGLACIIGGIIGLERENLNRPAGFRTHILVCVGSALIMIISVYGFSEVVDQQGVVRGDPARLAAQVVSGIGFLGAGTIIREGTSVTGLTTAASLWAVAGIGLAIGVGMIIPALITTGLIWTTLVLFWRIEQTFLSRRKHRFINLVIEDQPGQIGKIGTVLGANDIHIKNIHLKRLDENQLSVQLFVKTSSATCSEDVLTSLEQLEGIHSVTLN